MKKHLLIVIACVAMSSVKCAYAQNPVPNPGFENWTAGEPDMWSTSNITGAVTNVTQTTPPHTGAYAVKGDVASLFGSMYSPLLVSANAGSNGFPISQSYGTFSFYYKFNKAGADEFFGGAALYDVNGNAVADAAQNFTASALSYTLATVPFYYLGTNPVSAVITFIVSDSAGSAALGSYFVVDDVSFSGTVGINDVRADNYGIEKVSPNPANGSTFIYYSLPGNGDVLFELTDLAGRKYNTITLKAETKGAHKVELNTAAIPAGYYFLAMKTDDAHAVAKVMVVH